MEYMIYVPSSGSVQCADHRQPGIAFPIAEIATQIDAARLLTWRALWMAADGVSLARGEGSMSKLAASEIAVRATERAIQTMSGGAT